MLKPKPTKIQPVIEAALAGIKERAGRSRLTLEIATSDEIDDIIADEDRLRQLLYNLLANAVGFSAPEGLVRLSCWLEAGDVVFAIEDQGVGIPKEQLDRVFERFESQSHGMKHRGAGLGLSIVKSLVELHGGTMQLDSEAGRGTTVTVRLPQLGKRREIAVDRRKALAAS